MKFISATKFESVYIEDDEGNLFERRYEDCWYRWYGETLETIHWCENLEEAYQEFIKDEET